MANITKRGELQWQAKVRRKGFPDQVKTFMYRDDAEKWARAREREIETVGFVDRRKAEASTLSDVMLRYQRDVTPSKKSAVIESIKIDVILKDPVLSKLSMSAVTSLEVAEWRDRRLKQVSGATVNREIDVLSTVINHARREWGISITNPIPDVRRPEKARGRDRRLSTAEEKYLTGALSGGGRSDDGTFRSGTRNPWLAPLMNLALETAMRRGELLALEWQHVDLRQRTAHLPDTKNGDARTVPLSPKAIAILRELSKRKAVGASGGKKQVVEAARPVKEAKSGPVFPTTAMALRKGFARALEAAQRQYVLDCKATRKAPDPNFLVDVHFHDTRHEAASRLAEKLSNVLELAAVTGHRDLRMLQRYYHPRASDLAKKLA